MPTESLTSIKLFSKATRMLVSMLVLFLRRRLRPSMPRPGEPRALGLDRDWSDDRFSAQTARAQGTEGEVKDKQATDPPGPFQGREIFQVTQTYQRA